MALKFNIEYVEIYIQEGALSLKRNYKAQKDAQHTVGQHPLCVWNEVMSKWCDLLAETNFCFNEKHFKVTSVIQRSFLDVNYSLSTNKINTVINVIELCCNDKEYLQLFLCCDTKPDKSHLKREGFILSHCLG